MSPRKFPINPRDIIDDIPDSLADRLREVGEGRINDAGTVDLRLIRNLLECGLTIEQTVATFASSPRGKDAWRRHMNFDAYLRRKISGAIDEMESRGWGKDGYAHARTRTADDKIREFLAEQESTDTRTDS